MVSRHLLDSLALVPYLQAFLERQGTPVDIVDVGTGGGLPGLPLAIAFPEIRVTLLDSNGKKTRFLFHTATKLELKNVQVENNRVENFSPINKFAIVTSRAFASLQAMIAGTAHLLADGGEYWAMKGQYPHAELADCEYLASLQAVHPLTVPGCDGDRHLVILTTNR
jgi:16S rRNA (guanine527-N7)-methyltransferase